eukprot:6198268-Pleurochrysis_carterae.AAC.2
MEGLFSDLVPAAKSSNFPRAARSATNQLTCTSRGRLSIGLEQHVGRGASNNGRAVGNNVGKAVKV